MKTVNEDDMIFMILVYVIFSKHLIEALNNGDLRLTNSMRLEVYYNYEWGTVCDDAFDDNAAKVACKQLGFSNGVSLGNSVEEGSGTIMLDQLKCTGSESKLYRCPSNAWKENDCSHSEDVGVNCNNLIPVDGGLSTWEQWTACSSSCNAGLQTRTRACTNPSPKNGGSCCHGESSQTIQCNAISCPVDGGWGAWTLWNSCNVTCGEGMRLRFRSCDYPIPAFGGLNCNSEDSEMQQCYTTECLRAIHGGWSSWTNWTDCSKPCNGGLKEKSRYCDSPAPSNGGLYCNGTVKDVALCNTFSCAGIETRMALATIVAGVSVGSILISIAFVLICRRAFAETWTLKKVRTKHTTAVADTPFTEDADEVYIYQESDQSSQAFNNAAYKKNKKSKDAEKDVDDSDQCDIYDICEENCYENF
ncbi:deleted in malignant brain tumors 1 protein-like [Mytilus californianus]|uniref:deleted in malignant brain tumors 1 protein-like n=1 Tax=Mytilus californianus TaxID=6549 RepID=UPI002245B99E|nr:deleted in malignant brain tumors 1 protein-like [Mytilus californianus]